LQIYKKPQLFNVVVFGFLLLLRGRETIAEHHGTIELFAELGDHRRASRYY